MKTVGDLTTIVKNIEQELKALDAAGNAEINPVIKRRILEQLSTLLVEVALLESTHEPVVQLWPDEPVATKAETPASIVEEVKPIPVKPSEQPTTPKPAPKVEEVPKPASKATLQETATQQNHTGSINDKMNQLGDKNVGDKLSGKPISQLQQGVPLNDRMLIIQHLFKGNQTTYTNAIKQLDAFNNTTDAMQYIKDVLMPAHQWDNNDEVFKTLIGLVRRRYMA